MRNRTVNRWWRRLAGALCDDRGSDTIQQLMWALFWLGVITAGAALIAVWVNGKVEAITGF